MIQLKIFICFLASLSLAACTENKTAGVILEGKVVQADSLPGSCPYLTKDDNGRVVMSWVRSETDSTSVFCYAVSEDGGGSFEKTIRVPTSINIRPHSENLPKIIFKPSGEIIALWGAANPNPNNKYSGLVFYSQSFDNGNTWTGAKSLVNDTASYDQRYYDVALLPSGEAAIIWLDNRTTGDKDGSGLYFASTSGRNGFQSEQRITQECCQCCRTDLYIDSKAGIHVLYRGIIRDSIRDMLHIVSNDGAKTFSSPRLINNDGWVIRGCPHTGPSMTENSEGLHYAWFTGGKNKGCFYKNEAGTAAVMQQADRISAAGSHPQIAAFADGNLLVAWDESVMVKGKPYKQIGVQSRSSKGITRSQRFITSDTSTASYPVVVPTAANTAIIAYAEKKAGRDYVMFQTVKVD